MTIMEIPSASDVRAALAPLSLKQLVVLQALSGVHAMTIYKINEAARVPSPVPAAAWGWRQTADRHGH